MTASLARAALAALLTSGVWALPAAAPASPTGPAASPKHLSKPAASAGATAEQAPHAEAKGDAAPWGEPHLAIIPRTDKERARIAAVRALAEDFSRPERFETHPAGKATRFGLHSREAFSTPSANMPFEREALFKLGNGLFERVFEPAPGANAQTDGLGPIYNTASCQRCHLKDGRGHPPDGPQDAADSMFLRLSIPKSLSSLPASVLDKMPNAPEPVYGLQMQDRAIAGHAPEGRMRIAYEPVPVSLADGSVITLRRPRYSVVETGYGPLHPAVQLSPRIAPQMIGLGLIEAIPQGDILALADPEDSDGDGISGRPNRVWSAEFGQWMLGRFGLKAGAPTVKEQSAGAFAGDMGIANPLHPGGGGECTPDQQACLKAPHGYDDGEKPVEISAKMLDLVSFYARNLAVPARRDLEDPLVLRGKEVFYGLGCAQCHQPKFVTHRLKDQPEQSFQLIWPYSDFLLHDMGEGLADHRPEWLATGREWRTPPLWGIGMTKAVSGHSYFLHDGRARSLLEAVLWHGGEAEAAREAVRALPKQDRDALIRFLESL
ncbi:MAG: c-type cytochrome [Neomegalonema sp.]|nr:c-type cytochrome [Neomegalonema sp.]